MKRTWSNYRGIFYGLATALTVFLVSCSDDDNIDFNTTDSKSVQSEAASEALSDESQELVAVAVGSVTETQFSGRAEEAVTGLKDRDDRFKCAEVSIVRSPNSTKENPIGTITINFGTTGDCVDARGDLRRGKIIINYTGRRFFPGSKIVTTFDGFSVNGIQVEGTHTLTNIAPTTGDYPKFNIKIEGGKITFEDGSTITRIQDMTREWRRAVNPLEDSWVVTGNASGSNRDGKTYSMEIKKDLVYKRSCAINNHVFIAVEGTKVFTSDEKQITIDYGDGSCDNTVTITINGRSKDVEVTGKGD